VARGCALEIAGPSATPDLNDGGRLKVTYHASFAALVHTVAELEQWFVPEILSQRGAGMSTTTYTSLGAGLTLDAETLAESVGAPQMLHLRQPHLSAIDGCCGISARLIAASNGSKSQPVGQWPARESQQ
jgi:hypothetical protein